jgi:hypothetical protein
VGLAIALAALLLLAAPAEARRIDRCKLPDRAKVEALGGRLVVWSFERRDRWDDLVGKVVACRRSTGVSVRIADTYVELADYSQVARMAVAGDYVAYYQHSHDHYGRDYRYVIVWDAARRRELRRDGVAWWDGINGRPDADVPALAVTRAGNAVYVVRRYSDRDWADRPVLRLAVRTLERPFGGRLLDKGNEIDPVSLRLDGATVRWTNGGEARSAPLR